MSNITLTLVVFLSVGKCLIQINLKLPTFLRVYTYFKEITRHLADSLIS